VYLLHSDTEEVKLCAGALKQFILETSCPSE
jgi:hypothetical protein